MSNFESVIERFRAESDSTVELGNSFERLMKNFLLTAPVYNFTDVCLWSDFPQRDQFGGHDIGIDIVAIDQHNDYWAVQCKFYQPDIRIDKPAVDSFLAASSRAFTVDDHTVNFAQRLWISTTNLWNDNAAKVIENQTPPFNRIGLYELENADVDWQALADGKIGRDALLKKELRPHQLKAVEAAVEHYRHHERGKMIMACGTGKTFTSLKITERLIAPRGTVLYLTPSISLLNQTLIEWTAQSENPLNAICVCSDNTAHKTNDDVPVDNPILPSTTEPDKIIERIKPDAFNVIFSTYQSLDVVAQAQANSLRITNYELRIDLIICDEAHRTTGYVEKGADAPLFKRVHDNNFIRSKKRLYMTATPKLYTTALKKSATEKDLTLWSMDDETIFGEDFYVLKFSDALDHKLLTDYRVLVFTVREQDVPDALKAQFNVSDVAKIYGAANALAKKLSPESQYILRDDPNPMRSAVAYCSSIKLSKDIANLFNAVEPNIKADHVDGSMRSDQRKAKLSTLKNVGDGACHILTNARCLSEGIDVPALDAVLFMSTRKSQVDIIQAVGRVMRQAEGKHYGYVIVPVVIPLNADPVDELNHNKEFDTVWQVLNALRAHDDKFYIEVNKLSLNNGVNVVGANRKLIIDAPPAFQQLTLEFDEYRRAIVARIVEKVGDRQYWATWGRDVAVIAERHKARIKQLISVEGSHRDAFNQFLDGLHRDINPAVTVDEAIDMLAQHLITRPVFEALFEDFNFMERNAVSRSMQSILNLLDDVAFDKENATLQNIYKSVQERCADIKDAAERQKIIIELYDKFFKVALHKTVEKLGIVYTPVEVVDFILKSVDAVLRAEFGRTLADEGVHILDPFTGTGTFLTRLIELGLIDGRLGQKYRRELHANEIVLLAYYIACINIENAYHARAGAGDYEPFERICLTDTFQLAELDDETNLFSEILADNNEHIKAQRETDIQVIVGNPPYSVGQRSANDNAQNQKYPHLERRITDTYVKHTDATNKNSLYDSYIKAFRWASDRIGASGVIGFVTNGGWLDTAAMDGMRRCFEEEFTSIYVFNLRGNARTQGEARRRERDNVFGEGSRAPIAITVLVKNPTVERRAEIHYVDIGDYLDRRTKLNKIALFDNCLSGRFATEAQRIVPNDKHDWINQRGDAFDDFIPIEPDKKFDASARSFFSTYSKGIMTARDAWCYNFSRSELEQNMRRTISFYNEQRGADEIDRDSTQISWADGLIQHSKRGTEIIFDEDRIVESMYRPFCRQLLYYDRILNERTYQMPKIFPTGREDNRLICVTGLGSQKMFSVLMIDLLPDVMIDYAAQCFPQYWYDGSGARHSGVTDHILQRARERYGSSVSKDDIFYYVYGFLHEPLYRERFANELRKSLPKLILVSRAEDFWALSGAGRALADLHLHYEAQPAPDGVEVEGALFGDYRVSKMKLSKDRRTLTYNNSIVIRNIPLRAYDYVVNGRSPLEWVLDRYRVKVDKASGLVNDPNLWCEEHSDPDYILRLILSLITMSVKTMDIIDALPPLDLDG
ncbi:MAG: DEAD/DEAH box helicase [Selenomonadaceae bacterium]|nr:DEAD/DEAH box helicase [Selenomonadaceae bacterium]